MPSLTDLMPKYNFRIWHPGITNRLKIPSVRCPASTCVHQFFIHQADRIMYGRNGRAHMAG